MTTVYFMRHSEALKYKSVNNSDSLQLQNEKWPLTINGEQIAKGKSESSELKKLIKYMLQAMLEPFLLLNILQIMKWKLMNHLEKENLA